jgi:hypothetical protein
LALWPALVPSTAQPRIELLLDRPLDDQPSAEPIAKRSSGPASPRRLVA